MMNPCKASEYILLLCELCHASRENSGNYLGVASILTVILATYKIWQDLDLQSRLQ